jgi:hypothetical protein
MPDRLDELLFQLPMEPMSAGLPARIQRRLRTARSWQRRSQVASDAGLGILAIAGLLALAPSMAGAAGWLTGASAENAIAWIGRLGSGPAPVVWGSLTGAVDWARGLSDHFGVAGLLGLVLLSVPLFTWLRRLMPEAPEGAPAWTGAMLEEGAVS